MTRIWKWVDDLRGSYWFLPTLMNLGVLLTFGVLVHFRGANISWLSDLPSWVKTNNESARAILAAIAGGMVAITGTIFSITIVVLSLTSQQFGPRLLRTFLTDFATQLALGTFLSTGLFSFLVLRSIDQMNNDEPFIHLSVLASLMSLIISLGVFIYFIHVVVQMIQAQHLVRRVADELSDSIKANFIEPSENTGIESPFVAIKNLKMQAIRAREEGYVQAVDFDQLLHFCTRHDVSLRMKIRPGLFVVKNAIIAEIFSKDSVSGMEAPINNAILLGVYRTPRQDVEINIRELAEVAVRSLSPGINDPYTAATCIDYLGAKLCRIVELDFKPNQMRDEEGKVRIEILNLSFEDLLRAAFDQVRLYGRENKEILIKLISSLSVVGQFDTRGYYVKPLQAYIDAIQIVARNHLSADDLGHFERTIQSFA